MADFSGGASKDSYTGTSANDTISGGSGADTLDGAGGDDYIASGDRPNAFGFYGAQVPSLDTGTERDTLIGGAGNDHFYAGYGDNVDGGTYDALGNSLAISFLGASAGVTVDFSQNVIKLGGGTIQNIQNVEWIQGSNFSDTINANDHNTGYGAFGTVLGMGGDDDITTSYYTASIDGGDGNDTLRAYDGGYLRDIHGGNGDDIIYGPRNAGALVYGDAGNDTIYATYYASSNYGGAGDDHLYATDISNGVYLYGEDGSDTIDGSLGHRTTGYGGAGADTLIGSAGDDVLATDIRPDYLYTEVYDDFAADHDTVQAGDGNDLIAAGYGDDVDGGAGTDRLRLTLAGAAAATGKGITLALAKVIAADGTAFGGGKITGIETIEYIGTTNFADSVRVAGKKLPATLDTLGGNDVISSDGAAITILGGDGNDRYLASAGGGLFDGGAGQDKADFSKAAAKVTVTMVDSIDVGLIGGVAQLINVEDVLGSAFNDKITGNSADNLLRGGAGDDLLYGGGGSDTLDGGIGTDRLDGGQGDDTYVMTDTLDRIIETVGGGVDTVRTALTWKLATNVENLTLTGSAAADGTGNAAANVLIGNDGANLLKGLGGNDVLDGGAGGDQLDGGAGDDIYLINAFSDHASAEIVDSGSGGRDELRIAAGVAGQFTAYAGERGIERIVVGTGTGAVADRSGTAAINVDATALTHGAVIIGNAGINSLTGTSGDDLIGGGLGGDTLSGGEGADTLFGQIGADTLRGGGGADLLYGGEGFDTLTGGLGADTFAIGTDPYEGVDLITDFATGSDKLLVINPYLSGYLLAGGFRNGTYAQDSDDLAVYDKASGKLYADYDGNGPQAQVLLATFTPGTNLAASDILLIDTGSWQQQTSAAQAELLL